MGSATGQQRLDNRHVTRAQLAGAEQAVLLLCIDAHYSKTWLFCWTELGATHIGMRQSLIVTRRLRQVNSYDYLVDVLQRIGDHPNHQVYVLTDRLWKQHFTDNPMRSDLHNIGEHATREAA